MYLPFIYEFPTISNLSKTVALNFYIYMCKMYILPIFAYSLKTNIIQKFFESNLNKHFLRHKDFSSSLYL